MDKGVRVFTTVRGPILVKRGVLMGIAREDYQPLGNFYAKTIAHPLIDKDERAEECLHG